jgi:hypothetical protein
LLRIIKQPTKPQPLMKKLFTAAVFSVACSAAVFAANVANDNAGNSAYSDGWTTGDNGGTGFGNWTLTSTPNGGFAGSYVGGTSQGNPSFGIFAGNSSTALFTADRPFTGGALTAGQSFSVSLGNTVSIAGEIGFQFLSGSTARWTLKFIGGGTDWQINDGGGSDFGAGQAYAANTPLAFSFTYNGGNSYSYTFGTGSGNNFTAANDLSNLTGVRFYNRDQGPDQNLGFNNLSVVPEPSTYALLALSAAGLGAHVIRRRRR